MNEINIQKQEAIAEVRTARRPPSCRLAQNPSPHSRHLSVGRLQFLENHLNRVAVQWKQLQFREENGGGRTAKATDHAEEWIMLMLALGIVLTILGAITMEWSTKEQAKSVFEQPKIFHRTIVANTITLVWIGLLIGGLYCLWQYNPKIVMAIIGFYTVPRIFAYLYKESNDRSRAKNVFRIYKQLKLCLPSASDEDIYEQTASMYFRTLRWDEDRIETLIKMMFGDRMVYEDIKDLASFILDLEKPGDSSRGFEKRMEYLAKTDKAIDRAYSAIIDDSPIVKGVPEVEERPELSKGTIEWMKSNGLDVEGMSNEQLAIFSEMDDFYLSNWPVRIIHGLAFAFVIGSLISLIRLDIAKFLILGLGGYVIWLIGHKIQVKRLNEKLREVSIVQYMQERATNNHQKQ